MINGCSIIPLIGVGLWWLICKHNLLQGKQRLDLYTKMHWRRGDWRQGTCTGFQPVRHSTWWTQGRGRGFTLSAALTLLRAWASVLSRYIHRQEQPFLFLFFLSMISNVAVFTSAVFLHWWRILPNFCSCWIWSRNAFACI